MQKSIKLALMLATLLLPSLRVFGQAAIVAVEENGHKVYVNDTAAAPVPDARSKAKAYRLVYWSQTNIAGSRCRARSRCARRAPPPPK
jgi:hypothetical protein